jgi:MoxR-like ATPase
LPSDTAGQKYPKLKYDYERFFDPTIDFNAPDEATARAGGDRPLTSPYHYDEDIIFAVNAALAANRPLLVSGVAGTGKSALAANIAMQLDWDYLPEVITGRTEGRDLLWRFDTVRRLRDAYGPVVSRAGEARGARPGHTPRARFSSARADEADVMRYVTRGVLWRAFDASGKGERVVVLIDEIDKADPDVPNSLLEVLGNGRFTFDETGVHVAANDEAPPFVVITTNDERELSRPFRRRCVTLALAPPDEARLVTIADTWNLARDGELVVALAREVADLGGGDQHGGRLQPNVAEFLDALRVCLEYNIRPDTPEWKAVKRFALLKDLDPPQQSG